MLQQDLLMSFFFGGEAGSPNVNPLLTMIIRHGFILIMRKLKNLLKQLLIHTNVRDFWKEFKCVRGKITPQI